METNAFLIVVLNTFVSTISLATIIYVDAKLRNSKDPLTWGIGSATFPPVAIYYILCRKNIGCRGDQVILTERVAGTIWVATILAGGFSFLYSPPDPISIGNIMLYAYIPSVLIGYLAIGKNGWIYHRFNQNNES